MFYKIDELTLRNDTIIYSIFVALLSFNKANIDHFPQKHNVEELILKSMADPLKR